MTEYDGTVEFDPINRTITINSDYFNLPSKAIKFWRNIGFDIILTGETQWEV